MTNRLSSIYSLLRPGIGLADVGTDHGYIPVLAAQSGYSGNIIASDINRGPLESAVSHAESSGVSDKIRFVLCDGLNGIDPSMIDTVIIAGMGGDLICRILDETLWILNSRYHLILQPMTKSEVLRYWLVNNGFEIQREVLTEDSDKLYQIISARFTGENTYLSDAELFTGAASLMSDRKLFVKRIDALTELFEKNLNGLIGGKREEYKIDYVRHILSELNALR